MSALDWIKKSLMGSTTMPAGTGGGSVLQTGHVHKAGGGCCGHDNNSHDHSHEHKHHAGHKHGDDCCSGAEHDHGHDEDCTSPKGGCC